jgi:predicted amidohydrolase
MRVAALQHDIVWADREANFGRLAPRVAGAAADGAELILLAETFSTGFGFTEPGFEPEPEGGPSSQFLAAQAATHGVWVGGSCPEVRPGGDLPSNSFVLAGPDGTQHRYRKIHPFSHAGEEKYVDAGDELVTVQIAGLRVSLFVCYDLRFADEFWQRATGTDVYLVPANWPARRREHWIALLRARAIENQAYVVGCNRVGVAEGEGGRLDYSGDSMIIDPLGQVLASASGVETTISADVTAATVAEVRDRFRFLQDRRGSDPPRSAAS